MLAERRIEADTTGLVLERLVRLSGAAGRESCFDFGAVLTPGCRSAASVLVAAFRGPLASALARTLIGVDWWRYGSTPA
jgi:hypothetical protein